jgi:hypothetical protein
LEKTLWENPEYIDMAKLLKNPMEKIRKKP